MPTSTTTYTATLIPAGCGLEFVDNKIYSIGNQNVSLSAFIDGQGVCQDNYKWYINGQLVLAQYVNEPAYLCDAEELTVTLEVEQNACECTPTLKSCQVPSNLYLRYRFAPDGKLNFFVERSEKLTKLKKKIAYGNLAKSLIKLKSNRLNQNRYLFHGPFSDGFSEGFEGPILPPPCPTNPPPYEHGSGYCKLCPPCNKCCDSIVLIFECEGTACPLCTPNDTPDIITATIQGVENYGCEDCDDLNAAFELEFTTGEVTLCNWTKDVSICPGEGEVTSLELVIKPDNWETPTKYTLEFHIWHGGSANAIPLEILAEDFNCESLNQVLTMEPGSSWTPGGCTIYGDSDPNPTTVTITSGGGAFAPPINKNFRDLKLSEVKSIMKNEKFLKSLTPERRQEVEELNKKCNCKSSKQYLKMAALLKNELKAFLKHL